MLSSLPPLYGQGFMVAYAQLILVYYVCGALIHLVIPHLFHVKTIQSEGRQSGAVVRDAVYSLGPLAVKAAIWYGVEELHRRGWSMLYNGPVDRLSHVAYLVFCLLLLDYLHDAWFYLTHRFLHWKPVYRHIHYIHHKSVQPSAFTGYSFHLVEAVIVFFNEILVCWMFPIHMGLHRWYHLFTTIIHEGGHAGYEMAPFIPTCVGLVSLMIQGSKRAPPPALNTVQHHDMHHRYPTKHFSLYFTHLDRIFGTLHPTYDQAIRIHFNSKG